MNSSSSLKANSGSVGRSKKRPVATIKKKRVAPTATTQQQSNTNTKNVKGKSKAISTPNATSAETSLAATLGPHVDRNAYECTVHDLNQKLSHLRSHLTLLNDTNALLMNTLRILELDRAEAVSYYMRNVDERNQAVMHLEERLRSSEFGDSQVNSSECHMLNVLEEQYKNIHGQLTCEIKMLTSKLQSLEQFRLRRDQLLAKLDNQRIEIEASETAHREILFDVEQKMIAEKQALQQEVESKLQQLSKDFIRYSKTIPTDFVNCLQQQEGGTSSSSPRALEALSNVTRPQLVFRNCRSNWRDESII